MRAAEAAHCRGSPSGAGLAQVCLALCPIATSRREEEEDEPEHKRTVIKLRIQPA